MQQSYTKNYIKIYTIQILSMLLGFVSFFIVVPYLSTDKITYGIYTVCISVTIFLSYADLGFLGAGTKYAAESYSRGDKEKEISLIGFTHFILLVFVLLISCFFLFLYFNPHLLIKDLEQGYQYDIAKKLLLILVISSPIVVGQRMLQMIFSIRLQEYNIQIINIIGSLLKITSLFIFFGNGRYNIVGYYFFLQIISFLVVIAGIILAKHKYNYNFKLLFKNFKFSKEIFNHTKVLAFSTLFGTIAWILYYELDSIAIGRIIGVEAVAIYAIGFTILNFFRSILGVFFSPFSARFNHFVGLGNIDEFKSFYNHVITIMFPLVVFPIIAIFIMAKGLTISWVGIEYTESVIIVKLLIFCNILGFISYPAGMMLYACEKIKQIYFISAIMPLIFWIGILFTVNLWGIKSFAIFKIIVFFISGIIYLYFSLKYLETSIIKFINNIVIPYLPGLIIMGIFLWFFKDYFIDTKSKLNLFYNLLFIASGCIIAFGISILTSKQLRKYISSVFFKLRSKTFELD